MRSEAHRCPGPCQVSCVLEESGPPWTERGGWMGGSSRRPHLRPCKLSPCRTSSAWLSSGQGSGQVLPPPTPRLLSEGLAFLVLPSRCCPPRLWRCPVLRPPGEGRVLRMHSASALRDVPHPTRKLEVWQQGRVPRAGVQALTLPPARPGKDTGTTCPAPRAPQPPPSTVSQLHAGSVPLQRAVQVAKGRVRGPSPHIHGALGPVDLAGPGAPLLESTQMEVTPGGR